MLIRALLWLVPFLAYAELNQEIVNAFHAAATLAEKEEVLASIQRSNGALDTKEATELKERLNGMMEVINLLEEEPAIVVKKEASKAPLVPPVTAGVSEDKPTILAELPMEDTVMADEKLAAVSKSLHDASKGLDFLPAFISSVSMILVSEIGDKTFFIAAIMAMRHNRVAVFVSALSALILMTVLSAVIGVALPTLLPRRYTHYAATALFLFFGLRLLKDAQTMHGGASEELEEVESEIASKKNDDAVSTMEGGARTRPWCSPVFIQCFTLTFLAEWGDRSQIATIALAAAKDPIGVTLGGILGHASCTGLAVIGGKLLASRISERTVAIVGGILFLLFALHSMVVGPEGDK
jgi:putative Ca2+/H+ antiporter (TMEM165/GDT1 family)